ncbi:MAG: hypothetical protein ABIP63_05155 [Thermoanaerobaculia bacterium]
MTMMRFTIEQRHLTDKTGQPVTDPAHAVSFHALDADNIDQEVSRFAAGHSAEVIGAVVKFPGFQAMATLRNPTGVFTLQIGPASQRLPVKA